MIIWAVTDRDPAHKVVVLCQGDDREDAKREARRELGGNSDDYIVSPLSRPDDAVVLKLNIEGKVGE